MSDRSRHLTDQRRRLLATIHVAKKDLAMADDDYREMLRRLTGLESAADCSLAELHRVVSEMERLGFRNRRRGGGTANPASHPVARKARALWIGLHALGAVEDGSERALEAFGKRQLGVDRLHWADRSKAGALIEALKGWAEREGWDQAVPTKLASEQRGLLLKARLAALLAARLVEAGEAVRVRDGFEAMSAQQLDAAIQSLGDRFRPIRKAG